MRNVLRANATWLLPRAGALEAARQLVNYNRGEVAPDQSRMSRAYPALAEGRASEAVALLDQGVNYSTPARALRGLEALGDAWVALGSPDQAIRVLEHSSLSKEQAYCMCGSAGMFWMRTQHQLAQLYREVGREVEARAIESELLALLAYADTDHPMLLDLQQRSGASAN